VLLPRDQLERQYSCNAVQPQAYTSSCTAATVRNVIPDPDVSQSFGDSLEYVDSTTLYFQRLFMVIQSLELNLQFYCSDYELVFSFDADEIV
jgi:hypothetical protein